MKTVTLSTREASVLWQGDAVVLGATWAGIASAVKLAKSGIKTALVGAEPVLGLETSWFWRPKLPSSEMSPRLQELVAEHGVPTNGTPDPLMTTIAFDVLALEAGVDCFVKLTPTRLLSRDNAVTAVEVVGKSGRQLLQAPQVYDATPGRIFSRSIVQKADAAIAAAVRRAYVGGLKVEGGKASWDTPMGEVRAVAAAWDNEAIIEMDASTSSDHAERLASSIKTLNEAFVWLRSHVPAFGEATLVDVAPELDLCFKTDDFPGLPDCPSEIDKLDLSQFTLKPQCTAPAGEVVETSELRAAPEWDLPVCTLPPVSAQLHEVREAVVAGFGTGGAFAAIAAAEEGLSVAIVDPATIPGGIGSAGRISSYYHGLRGGMQDRLDEEINGLGASTANKVRGYHPVSRTEVIQTALQKEQSIHIFPGHTVFGTILENNSVQGILTAAANGYHVFPCRVAIDGTGDGDLLAAADAPFTLGRDGDGFPQPYSYTPSWIRDGNLHHHNFDAGWVDPTDSLDFSRAHFEGRERIWEKQFSQENHYCTLASIIGLRESRFALGEQQLTFDDFLLGRTYPDTVCSSFAHHDNHAMDYAEESEWSRRHVVMFGLWQHLLSGHIPYSALLPQEIDGLLIACRALSVDHDLHQLVRMQRDIQVFGEITGVAAALAVNGGTSPRAIDLDVLREKLRDRNIAPQPPDARLDLPVEELLDKLSEEGQTAGLAMWRLSLATGNDMPDWESILPKFTDPLVRFRAAVAAAEAGCASPAVIDELEKVANARQREPLLGTKSAEPFLLAALALADLNADCTPKLLDELLNEDSLMPQDVLLVLKAFAITGRPEGVASIKKFLSEQSEKPFAMSMWGVAKDGAKAPFRPMIIMRAVRSLIALGCTDEVYRLDEFVDDPSLLFRRHARRVLAEADPQLA